VLLSVKTKLDLNSQQRVLMAKHAGISRFTYNWGLATWTELYKSGFKPNHLMLKKFFNNEVKPALAWIKEKGICQKITEFAFEHLGTAFKNFFDGKSKYPKFKRKHGKASFTINAGGKPIPVGGKRFKLPTIGWVRTHEGIVHAETKSITISECAGDWYISYSYEQPSVVTSKSVSVVGADVGIKFLVTLSTGVVFANPKARDKALVKLRSQQRQLSKKVPGSNRYKKQRLRVATTSRRVANIRLDATHKSTTYISKNHAVIVPYGS